MFKFLLNAFAFRRSNRQLKRLVSDAHDVHTRMYFLETRLRHYHFLDVSGEEEVEFGAAKVRRHRRGVRRGPGTGRVLEERLEIRGTADGQPNCHLHQKAFLRS